MDVLCVGHAAWDVSVYVAEYPAENSKCETRTLLECGGGPAANAAFLLSSWGLSCALATTVGHDAYADRVLEELARAGTDVSLAHRSEADATPVSIILVNETNGSRTIVNRKTAAAAAGCRISARPDWAEPPKVLLFDGHEPQASLEAMALFPHARTILDAGSARPGAVELARRVDYLVASERFARQLVGGFGRGETSDPLNPAWQAVAIETLHRHNGRPVVITLGERGLLHGTTGRFEHLPAFPVKAVDTTAAGDIFHGAFAYGVFAGLPWDETLRLASATAALSTTLRGGRSSIPSLDQVQEFLARVG
jgi:sugar/nucleoside kinase (ribokinase family)